MTQDTRTEIERAYEIIAAKAPDMDALFSGRMAARARTHDCHENPFIEQADPIQWASWWAGYYSLISTVEDGR